MRRNGAHSVSDWVGKAWWERSRDIAAGDMPAPMCGGRENVGSCTMERRAEPERNGAAKESVVVQGREIKPEEMEILGNLNKVSIFGRLSCFCDIGFDTM